MFVVAFIISQMTEANAGKRNYYGLDKYKETKKYVVKIKNKHHESPTTDCNVCPPLSACNKRSQSGAVMSGSQAVPFATVTIYQARKHKQNVRRLGSTQCDANGQFNVHYKKPSGKNAVLYMIADGERKPHKYPGAYLYDSVVRLATVLGKAPYPNSIIINERTTVATAYAMAQFIKGMRIGGPSPGMPNAAATVRNLVDLSNGGIGYKLDTAPNGDNTSARPTLNSLSNMLSACVRSVDNCDELFENATPFDGPVPHNTLDAMVNIAHNPGNNVSELLGIAQNQKTYRPALPYDADTNANRPNFINSWVLAILYTGAGISTVDQLMDGPGNIAIDKHGNAWININYVYSQHSTDVVCGSTKLVKLTPTGDAAPGSPFGGDDTLQDGVGAGGLYGAGFGIAIDPKENVWVSNFGFQGRNGDIPNPSCSPAPDSLAVSVSVFRPDGTAISRDGDPSMGLAGGYPYPNLIEMIQPQGIRSDRRGNVWVAGCVGGTVTRFNRGNPDNPLFMKPQARYGVDFDKAFDIAIDTRGHGWVTGNLSSNVIEFNRNFEKVGEPVTGISLPMGIAADSFGNLWVADAGKMSPPCPAISRPDDNVGEDGSGNTNAAVSLIVHEGENRSVTTYKRNENAPDGKKLDGLRWPWGIAVDGNDNVWVANFGGNTIMHMRGTNKATWPLNKAQGDTISPDEGYINNALQRITAVRIDPSGNVWMTNNWINEAFEPGNTGNPGGHEVVVFIGLAGPVKTPLIGVPRQP